MKLSLAVSLTGILTTLNIVGRISLVVLPNISPVSPLTLLAGYLGGSYVGFLVGFMSMFISDVYIGPGPWTLITSLGMGLVGVFGGLIRRLQLDYTLTLVISFIIVLFYDIFTSIILMYPFGVPPYIAVINLFIPAIQYGIPYPMGPMHEFTSSVLFVGVLRALRRYLGESI